MSTAPGVDLTVLVCTYNRSAELAAMLTSALAQEGTDEFRYEILVVDNNSTDSTRAVVQGLIREDGAAILRYQHEPKQGKTFALNAGLKAARGSLFAIIDDDQHVPPTYLRDVVRAFRARPAASFLGGKVLPLWGVTPPSWLTPDMWAPLAACDYGPDEFEIMEDKAVCLLSCVFRIEAVHAVGGFADRMFVSEDAELQNRLRAAGFRGFYVPSLLIYHKAAASRLTRSYYRSWHTRHGRSIALLHESSRPVTRAAFLNVPLHLYRQLVLDSARACFAVVRADFPRAFRHELSVRFLAGYFRQSINGSSRRGRGRTGVIRSTPMQA